MPDNTDLTDQIADGAAEPISSSNGDQSATGRPLGELIEADRYLKGQQAVSGTNPQGGKRSGWGKLRTARSIPPGAA